MPYYPIDIPSSPSVGVKKIFADNQDKMIKVSEEVRIDRVGREIREIRYLIGELDSRITIDTRTPEPSVEIIDLTPTWISRLLKNIKNDPMREIFRII